MDALVAGIAEYRYFIIFPLAIAEGPVIMMLSGFLLRIGILDSFWILYAVLSIGDMVSDVLWYAVGRFGGHALVRKYGKYVSLDEALLTKTEHAFHRHQNKILFLSKITMGFGFALVILVTAGIMRIPFRRYLALNAAGQIVWTAALMAIGFFFGSLYLLVDEGLRIMAIIAFSAVALGGIYGANRYLRQKDLENRL
jgi:membrane-associated protein